jgi:transposase-like protein
MAEVLHTNEAKRVFHRKSEEAYEAYNNEITRMECKCGNQTFFVEEGYVGPEERFVCSKCGQGYEWYE